MCGNSLRVQFPQHILLLEATTRIISHFPSVFPLLSCLSHEVIYCSFPLKSSVWLLFPFQCCVFVPTRAMCEHAFVSLYLRILFHLLCSVLWLMTWAKPTAIKTSNIRIFYSLFFRNAQHIVPFIHQLYKWVATISSHFFLAFILYVLSTVRNYDVLTDQNKSRTLCHTHTHKKCVSNTYNNKTISRSRCFAAATSAYKQQKITQMKFVACKMWME